MVKRRKSIEARIKRMREIEEQARALHLRLSKLESEWETDRDSELLESDEYRAYCEKFGIYRHYNWGDVVS